MSSISDYCLGGVKCKKKSLIIILVLVLMLSSVLAGCGNADNTSNNTNTENVTQNEGNSGSTNQNTESSSESETNALEEAAKTNPAILRGNILTASETSFDGKFNPVFTDGASDFKIANLVFDGLIKVNKNAEYVPSLANWEISEDKLTYTFF